MSSSRAKSVESAGDQHNATVMFPPTCTAGVIHAGAALCFFYTARWPQVSTEENKHPLVSCTPCAFQAHLSLLLPRTFPPFVRKAIWTPHPVCAPACTNRYPVTVVYDGPARSSVIEFYGGLDATYLTPVSEAGMPWRGAPSLACMGSSCLGLAPLLILGPCCTCSKGVQVPDKSGLRS